MLTELRHALSFTLVTLVLFGGAYHGLVWTIGRFACAEQAAGSLFRRADGSLVGSRLIAQAFTRAEYFHPRPSAVDYNAAGAGGTNDGPSNPHHLDAVRARLDAVRRLEQVGADRVPVELVTASGSGLDPHLSPAAAALQAPRIAAARGVPVDGVEALIAAHTQAPLWGLFGRPRVNVLELNLALDGKLGTGVALAAHGREERNRHD